MEVIKTMAKCMKCGKSTLVKGHVKLADGAICTPCFRSLGFKLGDVTTSSQYRYDDIKDGATLVLEMGSRPNKEWGSAESATPPSAPAKQ